MKTEQYQPVNEWNSYEKTPPSAGDQAWKNVVPDTRGTMNPDGGALTLAAAPNGQYADNFAMLSTNQPNVRY